MIYFLFHFSFWSKFRKQQALKILLLDLPVLLFKNPFKDSATLLVELDNMENIFKENKSIVRGWNIWIISTAGAF